MLPEKSAYLGHICWNFSSNFHLASFPTCNLRFYSPFKLSHQQALKTWLLAASKLASNCRHQTRNMRSTVGFKPENKPKHWRTFEYGKPKMRLLVAFLQFSKKSNAMLLFKYLRMKYRCPLRSSVCAFVKWLHKRVKRFFSGSRTPAPKKRDGILRSEMGKQTCHGENRESTALKIVSKE